MALHTAAVHLYLVLQSIPFYDYTTIYLYIFLSILLLMDTFVQFGAC